MNWRAWPTAALLSADCVLLVAVRRVVATTAHHVMAPHAWLARVGTDAALASLAAAALWLVAAGLAVGLLAALAAGLPGALGRAGTAVSRTLLPQAVLRLLAGSAGLSVLLAPVAAGAQPVSHGSALMCASTGARLDARPAALPAELRAGRPISAGQDRPCPAGRYRPAEVASTKRSAAPLPAPVWPTAAPAPDRSKIAVTPARPSTVDPRATAADRPSNRQATLPAPAWPTSEPSGRRPAKASPSTAPPSPGSSAPASSRPTTLPAPTWPTVAPAPSGSPSAPRPASGTPAGDHQPPDGPRGTGQTARPAAVRVRPGDSLWLIAARRLGPRATPAEIAAAWPRWYAANRAVIGADPALIVPGQMLHSPDEPSGASR